MVKTRLDQSGFADGSDVMAFVDPEEETKNYMRPGRLGFLCGFRFLGRFEGPSSKLSTHIDFRNLKPP